MRILLINPPYQTLTSNLGVGHQVPLGLLMVGSALIDAGHEVRLLDAEARHLSITRIVREVGIFAPEVVMTGHAGSTPAHPTCVKMLRAIRSAHPACIQVYGGVYPSYHAEEILAEESIDFIVRGEGEAAAVELMALLSKTQPPEERIDQLVKVPGISFRGPDSLVHTLDRTPIRNLDDFRTAWELIRDWDRYQCFGLGRAAIVQFSRGCPHRCTYCGQHGFWKSWRYRDPVRLVDEIEWLHRTHDIRFVTLADENPTTLPDVWRRFLEELAGRKLDVHFFCTIRATDIVRDESLLPLYRAAGILYVLMGVDTTDAGVQQVIRKNSSVATDQFACRLLRQNGIFAMLGYVVGFDAGKRIGIGSSLRQLARYEADLLNAMFVAPHRWTEFAAQNSNRLVVQPNLSRWDYRHQVLLENGFGPWRLFFGVKWIELWFHLRPRKLAAWFKVEKFARRQVGWCFLHMGLVWFGEIIEFLVATRFARPPIPLKAFQTPALLSSGTIRRKPSFSPTAPTGRESSEQSVRALSP